MAITRFPRFISGETSKIARLRSGVVHLQNDAKLERVKNNRFAEKRNGAHFRLALGTLIVAGDCGAARENRARNNRTGRPSSELNARPSSFSSCGTLALARCHWRRSSLRPCQKRDPLARSFFPLDWRPIDWPTVTSHWAKQCWLSKLTNSVRCVNLFHRLWAPTSH